LEKDPQVGKSTGRVDPVSERLAFEQIMRPQGKQDSGGVKPLLFIHVGPPKTGTTSLQHYFLSHLEQNRAVLEYPEIGLAKNTEQFSAHHNLARYFSSAPRVWTKYSAACGGPEDLLRLLASRQSTCPVLLSSEGFWILASEAASKRRFECFLSALRHEFLVTALVTWRNVVDLSLSRYFYGAKDQVPAPFPRPVQAWARRDAAFWRNLTDIAELVDQVLIVKYSRDIVASYINVFRNTFGLELASPPAGIRENISFNTAQKMFALVCSKIPDALAPADYKRILKRLSSADFGQSVALKLDASYEQLRQQSEEVFEGFVCSGNIRIVDD
jgi:hypothetical protein